MTVINPMVVFVDVDDTLVRSVGSKRIPLTNVIANVRALHASGVRLYCWSTGGADYAKASAQELGIDECFEDYLPKPNVMIDDQAVSEWRGCIEVHPLNATHTAGEYEALIKQR
jgi:predicted HAD superfamily phosphohydrolase YqeG